ncbi:MAG TPA: protease pro-enzyme activation domain-containing protein, partial [Chthonomonadaceae bacterium]|nr:protease pro-enzyme activation domain-containing protein [Chthonomonadaceae bacterium]
MKPLHTVSSIGIAAVSAALLALLGGLLPANAQAPSAGKGKLLSAPQSAAIQRAVPMTPQQQKTLLPPRAQSLSLPPIPNAKHPIPAPVQLADPSVLAGPMVALPGHVPGLVSHASKLEAVDSNEQITLTFALKPAHQKEMDALARRLYDPKDAQFHHFLKPAERIARFSPSVEDFNKVVAFAQQCGLQVTDASPDRLAVMATGTAGRIQNALGVHLDTYKAEDGTAFYAPDRDPKVPAGIAPLLFCIQQLDNIKPKSDAIFRPVKPSGNSAGSSGSASSYGGSGATPDDIGIWGGTGMPAGEVQKCYQLAYSASGIPL